MKYFSFLSHHFTTLKKISSAVKILSKRYLFLHMSVTYQTYVHTVAPENSHQEISCDVTMLSDSPSEARESPLAHTLLEVKGPHSNIAYKTSLSS